ncbi:MAG: hypothetical protein K0R02_40 [Rickettsiaceae bacterium]|jgi:hypothetical protein|nr:hypothetical protein [Rickettsiaceae bacterium]
MRIKPVFTVNPNGCEFSVINPQSEEKLSFSDKVMDGYVLGLTSITFNVHNMSDVVIEEYKINDAISRSINRYTDLSENSTFNFAGNGQPVIEYQGEEFLLEIGLYPCFLSNVENMFTMDADTRESMGQNSHDSVEMPC